MSQSTARASHSGFRTSPSSRWSSASLVCGFAALLVPVLPTFADDDPAAELASFKVADGFEVNLFASEKDGIVKPIQIRWDERGRLWVVGSQTYPQVRPTEEPNDKVWILEDTDGDGKSDKTTVFADGLMIPTGLELAPPANLGSGVSDDSPAANPKPPKAKSLNPKSCSAYIGEGTKLWLMTDEDGDGRADRREIVLRGFGTGDNHQNINSFRWSPGGELMFCQGLHSFSRVETPYGIAKLEEAGLWQFRPGEQRLDAFYGGAADPQNPWGWTWTRWGQPLVVAGNNGTMFYPLPEMIRGWQGGRRDSIWVNGRSRKTSGPEIIESRHFPDEWQGVMVAGGYINNALWTLKIEDDGAGFRIIDHPTLPPLITSTHGSFRPVDVKLGPDGALYICDWYNPIIGHYQASFRHPDRDKVHGRIWRITAKGRALNAPLARPKSGDVKGDKDSETSISTLVSQLIAPDRFVREQAKRQLFGGDTAGVTNAVRSWADRLDPSAPDTEFALVQALGVLQAHDIADVSLLARVLKAKTPDARAFAATTLARWADRLPADFPTIETLADLAHDESPRVRLAAVVAAGNIARPESIIVVLSAAEQPRDKFIDTALRAATAVLKPHWEPIVSKNAPGWKPAWRDLLADLSGSKKATTQATAKSPVSAGSSAPMVLATGQLKATPDFVAALVADVRAKGDVKHGSDVFHRAELACFTCHKVGDQGGVIGPALDAIGSAQPLDFIIGAVLEPQREVKEGFETYSFALKDGRAVVGSIVAGTAERLTVREPTGTEQTVSASDVTEKKMIGSLMPAGLVDRLSREDLRDLFAYLSSLGRAK